ncbi:IDEAL domain-containing protein [Listeria booriae]|uniref:IDEAL domain-containing protein n=1 Tax=Listeria booriae TaxID=1552123 RepID=A0A7X0XW26_9LIST|nr:IDEAL domain-containing protein [Listeria booriae]MBC1792818.1 IDEAL domain-containing protein [Listeria booriae]MBC1804816.1 IDEAL domain-containing protein [Listeria booriae]MBC2324994.1 IDEAL domain-containing protein [Listeria booriae]MCD2208741.1 IDEAL domain-containing protein [Listeria booriae]MDT0112014.1 IDEAL domain-containing protein [Listeria booriae]
MEMRDFSSSLVNQVGVLKGEKELMNTFIECYMTMLLDEHRIQQLKDEIDVALDNQDKEQFYLLTEKLKDMQLAMLHL